MSRKLEFVVAMTRLLTAVYLTLIDVSTKARPSVWLGPGNNGCQNIIYAFFGKFHDHM